MPPKFDSFNRPPSPKSKDGSEKWSPDSDSPPPLTPEHGFNEIHTEKVPASSKEATEDPGPVPILDRSLMQIGVASPEEKKKFLTDRKNLSPDSKIHIYHGINGGLEGALSVLDSEDHGVRQRGSSPTFCLYPVGQFWKPGDAGFRYTIQRKDVEFPGENNPAALFRVSESMDVYLLNDLEVLPVSEFGGEVLRTIRKEDVYKDEWSDEVIGERIVPLSEKEKEIANKIEQRIKELKG